MLIESRRILALMGDQKVTIAAFLALVIYGAALLIRRDGRWVRMRAVLILGTAALWLAVVLFGAIRGDLAQWSSLAVFLFAIGIEGNGTAFGTNSTNPHLAQIAPEFRAAVFSGHRAARKPAASRRCAHVFTRAHHRFAPTELKAAGPKRL